MMAVRTAVEQLGVIQLAAIRLVVQMMVDQPATVPVPAAVRALRQILNGSGWRKR
ncbi:MAG: hypothetical protein ACLVAW_00010 [Eisenbergiella massiliensis]